MRAGLFGRQVPYVAFVETDTFKERPDGSVWIEQVPRKGRGRWRGGRREAGWDKLGGRAGSGGRLGADRRQNGGRSGAGWGPNGR